MGKATENRDEPREEPQEETQQEPVKESKEKLELSDREKAIARGEDPDADVGDDTEVEDDGTDASNSEPGQDAGAGQEDRTGGGKEAAWVTDEVKDLAKSYGLSEDDLKTYASEDVFRQAVREYDRQISQSVEKPQKESKDPDGPEEEEEEIDLDVEKFREAGFDERSLDLVRYTQKLKAELEALKPVIQSQTQQQQTQQQQREAWEFHNAVDGMDETRYGRLVQDGKVVALNKIQDQARRSLFEAAETLRLGIVARAQAAGEEPQVPPTQVLLKRAEMMVFGDDIQRQEREAKRRQLEEQSRRRRPKAGRSKVSAAPKSENADPVKQIASHPDLVSFWNKAQEENGSE